LHRFPFFSFLVLGAVDSVLSRQVEPVTGVPIASFRRFEVIVEMSGVLATGRRLGHLSQGFSFSVKYRSWVPFFFVKVSLRNFVLQTLLPGAHLFPSARLLRLRRVPSPPALLFPLTVKP